MIAHLRGTIQKGQPGEATVDVQGVGYKVLIPLSAWENLQEGEERMLSITTFVREDRFDLYGFSNAQDRALFERLIELPGIGPKMGLELCSVPKSLFLQAIHEEDPTVLSAVKGIGKKTAEKLLIELKSLSDKYPGLLSASGDHAIPAMRDADTIAALRELGYSVSQIDRALQKLPKEAKTTEERVTAALRSL